MKPRSGIATLLDRADLWLESVAMRALLSVLILVSVLPEATAAKIGVNFSPLLFVGVFGGEFGLRAAITAHRWRGQKLRAVEIGVLVLDFLALVSFLPLATGAMDGFRYLRIARLLLLIGYWHRLLREIWTLVARPERRFQISIVLVLGAVLAFGSTALLLEFGIEHDFDGDGQALDDADDRSFGQVLWWSFRQIQDAGNLVATLDDPRLVMLSLVLTFAGLLLFSFFVGIGTTLVEELLERSRSQPLAIEGHSVILGTTPYTPILLHNLAEIYRKNLRPLRGAVLSAHDRGRDMAASGLRHFRFRHGDPSRPTDLDRVSVDRAKRVLVLGDDAYEPDPGVISAVLATRQRNPKVPLYADLEHERNFAAVRVAGGEGTHLIGSGPLLGYYVAQNVAYPEVYHLYRHLLQSSGSEIYTYIYSPRELARLDRDGVLDPDAIHRFARDRHRVTLLGFFVSEAPPEEPVEDSELELSINPVVLARQKGQFTGVDREGRLRAEHLRGVIGIASRFRKMTGLAIELLEELSAGEKGGGVFEGAAVEPIRSRGDFDSLELKPSRRDPRRILILGTGPRVPRVLRELIGFFPHLRTTVVVDTRQPEVEGTRASAAKDCQNMLGEMFGNRLVTEEEGDLSRLSIEGDGIAAQISIVAEDWNRSHDLEARGCVTLEEADVILLLPAFGPDRDTDGEIALDSLHLTHLERTAAVRFREGAHILALVRDPEKGDLLERRLAGMVGQSGRLRHTVISRERARHRFITQNVFVRGLNQVYLSLLGSRGQHFARVTPRIDGKPMAKGSFHLHQLAEHLLHERDLLLIGYEEHTEDEVRVVIDPEEMAETPELEWGSIGALYVLGDDRASVEKSKADNDR